MRWCRVWYETKDGITHYKDYIAYDEDIARERFEASEDSKDCIIQGFETWKDED